MSKSVRISLADKCQLLFGAAVVLIIGAALSVGWLRMFTLVREGQQETARNLASAWLAGQIEIPSGVDLGGDQGGASDAADVSIRLIDVESFEGAGDGNGILVEAIAQFRGQIDRMEFTAWGGDAGGSEESEAYRYIRAIRQGDLDRRRVGGGGLDPVGAGSKADSNGLRKLLVVDLSADLAHRQLMLNRLYVVAAGLLAGLLAIGVFWFITTRIILSPVRVLRDTAAKISEGDLNIRSDINTGDEFEQLSDMFNTMLEGLKSNQDELRRSNKSLDLKLGELAETNIALYEANKMKGEFLANVSHELRTPLNSIIGFAEVLEETLKGRTGPVDEKRKRYIANIITSSRQLLELINDLLDLAKIEAGRMEVRIAPVSIADTGEGLINLVRPQATKRGIELDMKFERGIPIVQTDPGKLQQILFNFLSNAIKFTPSGGRVTLSTRLVPAIDPAQPDRQGVSELCVSVSDTGPGIAIDQQAEIFEKFTQLDSTVTRKYSGTGLGLAISKDLAALLHGRIELESDLGMGANFSIIIPLAMETKQSPLMPNELAEGTATGSHL